VARELTAGSSRPDGLAQALGVLARSREATLAVVMVVLAMLVTTRAPAFADARNIQNVLKDTSIIAIAAIGEAMVIMTKNVDLSVESTIGLVAYVVGEVMRTSHVPMAEAWLIGIVLGLVLGMVNGVIVAGFRVPSIVATLGTLSVFRGFDFFVANGREINLVDLPPGYSNMATQTFFGVPIFAILAVLTVAVVALLLRYTVVGRQIYAVGSNQAAAVILGIRSRFTVFLAFTMCGLLAGIAGVLWGIDYGTIYATSASGIALQVIAAAVVGGVSISGGSGTVIGAALGALFLGLINNALLILLLPQEWLQLIYGAVILVAVSADAIVQKRTQLARARSRMR
jgi:rhamnose transport system permease protein